LRSWVDMVYHYFCASVLNCFPIRPVSPCPLRLNIRGQINHLAPEEQVSTPKTSNQATTSLAVNELAKKLPDTYCAGKLEGSGLPTHRYGCGGGGMLSFRFSFGGSDLSAGF